MIKVSVIFGTRPEAIKMAMLIKALDERADINLNVCFTGQHKEMVLPLIDFFDLKIDSFYNIMKPGQTLAGVTSRSFEVVDDYSQQVKPDLLLVQGDTTTAMCSAISAFYKKIKVGHVEAGLRTYNMHSPFPEEFNRQVITKVADLHFAPTELAFKNLITEHIDRSKVYLTGNTVIDALIFTQEKIKTQPQFKSKFKFGKDRSPFILITGHRRENFGIGFENICNAIKVLAIKYPQLNFVYPVHLNPNVQEPVNKILNSQHNIHLLPPLDYIDFNALLSECYFVLTDSGGIQEEAPALGKPVLVMRETTEREEAILAGASKLIGTNKDVIVEEASKLIECNDVYKRMSKAQNPFGKGDSSKQIVEIILKYFEKNEAINS